MEIFPDHKRGDIVKCYTGLDKYYTCEVLSVEPGLMSIDNKTMIKLPYTRLKKLSNNLSFTIFSDCVMSIEKYRELIIDVINEV